MRLRPIMKMTIQAESHIDVIIARCYTLVMVSWGLVALLYFPVIFMAWLVALIIQWTRLNVFLFVALGTLLLGYGTRATGFDFGRLDEIMVPWSFLSQSLGCVVFESKMVFIALALLLGSIWQGVYQWVRYGLRLPKPVVWAEHVTAGSMLGTDMQTGRPIYLQDSDANLHTLMVGTTGSGKTTAVCNVLQSAIDRQQTTFYVDGKGDVALAKRIAAYA